MFVKSHYVNAPGPSMYNSNLVSTSTPKESVGSNDIVHNYYLKEAKKKEQLQKDKALNSKPSVITPARLPNTVSGRIFTSVSLRWIPTRKIVRTCINMNDSALPSGKEIHTPKTVICATSSALSACTSMASEPTSSKDMNDSLVNKEKSAYHSINTPSLDEGVKA
ncbi:hypothetical protein Tco_0758035 [Tanacetum coccineum]